MTYPIKAFFSVSTSNCPAACRGRATSVTPPRQRSAKPVGPMPRALPKLDSQSIPRFHSGDGECCFAWLRHHHARIPGCRLACAGSGDGFRAPPRSCAGRNPRVLHRSFGAAWTSIGISVGRKPRVGPLMRWRCRGDARTSSPAARWSARQRATAAMPSGSSIKAKLHYDPDNIFNSAIPLPARQRVLAAE